MEPRGGVREPSSVFWEHVAAIEGHAGETLPESMLRGVARAAAILLGEGAVLERADRALREVAEASGAHRLQLFERVFDPELQVDRYERRILRQAPGHGAPVVPDPVFPRDLGIESHMADFVAGRPFEFSADDVPPTHPARTGQFGHRLLVVPVCVEERVWGALVLVNLVEGGRSWTPSEKAMLAALATVLGSAVERDRRQALDQTRRDRIERLSASVLEVASVAHDLNNLFSAVGMMLDEHVTDPGQRALVEGAFERVRHLTNGLVAAARGDAGDAVKQDVRLDAIALEAAHLVPVPAGFAIDVSGVQSCPVLAGLPDRLDELATNLLKNAVEALPDGKGCVAITVAPRTVSSEELAGAVWASPRAVPGPFVVLEVRDEGVGMSESVLAGLFEPFRTTKPGGTGLGMVSVLRTVQMHDGAIAVRTAPGRGTTVSVLLPVPEASAAR